MSRTKPDEGDRRMIRFRCGKCMAAPGDWCRVARGGWAPMLHAARFYEAVAAGALPIYDAPEARHV